MFERLPYRVMALHGGVIVGGDIYIQMTFNSAPLTSHDTMWERTIGPIIFNTTCTLEWIRFCLFAKCGKLGDSFAGI